MIEKRREFIKKVAITAGGLTLGGHILNATAKNYKRIIGANNKRAYHQ